MRLPMSPREEADERAREAAAEAEAEEPLCYDWCGRGYGLCLRPMGHDDDCSPYPDVDDVADGAAYEAGLNRRVE